MFDVYGENIMNKMEIKQKISELLIEGKPKHEVFKAFSGGAERDVQGLNTISSCENILLK